jgi:hypothetical protein
MGKVYSNSIVKEGYYALHSDYVKIIQRVCRRLYRDFERMNADEMRDNAQSLDYALDHMRELDI